MPIYQRQLFTATTFDFGADRLHYLFKTPRVAKRLSIDYADISLESRRMEQRHDVYLYAGYVLIALGAIFGAYLYTTEQRISGFSYALWGILFVIAYFVQRSSLIVYSVGGDPLIVLADGKAKEVIHRIDMHRKARFIELLGSPELAADAPRRQEFVSWLRERGALSEEEIATASSGGA